MCWTVSSNHTRTDETSLLYTEAGCLLLKDIMVIIPELCQEDVLKELHVSHSDIGKMKSLARVHVW